MDTQSYSSIEIWYFPEPFTFYFTTSMPTSPLVWADRSGWCCHDISIWGFLRLEIRGSRFPVPTSLGVLSLLPDNRYISVALGLAGLILHIINEHRPSNKLGRVEGAIESVAGTLKHAKEDYPWIHTELMGVTNRLFKATLLASKIQTRMLEPRSVKTWKEFAAYLQNSWEIMRDISQCANNVKEIQVSALCIIESERQRQLSAGIKESRELLGKVTCSLARASKSTQILGHVKI
ncbi:hypothetical protein K438DRAFT_2058360 [Mycena galopus ATCC 62051]|nr:hypothetical protein K438DRAFT_2058360 [Mycena galopus ATCC 62051]